MIGYVPLPSCGSGAFDFAAEQCRMVDESVFSCYNGLNVPDNGE